ncbi:uncharacterized protein PAC_06127 [Phialocephala subalpina]|uniref:2EXR domain-containing protein n=1 Tax=Phialocephala subalpina TaxID=576137 RepID=A0A1L7WU05_9HELO|nr:uncharacterized protein PAC_06127 [Phialocephala subalpina]
MAFRSFAQLPQELRDQIWQYAVWEEEGRVVEMNQNIKPPVGQDHWSCEYTSAAKIPGLLHACHDSREAALERWELRFAFLDEPLPHPPKVFFDFDTDTLYFGTKFSRIVMFVDGVEIDDYGRLCRLALDINAQYFPLTWDYSGVVSFFGVKFSELEHVVCVERFRPKYWDSGMANDVCPLTETRLSNAIQSTANSGTGNSTGSWLSYRTVSRRSRWVEKVRREYEAIGWKCPEFSIVLDTQRPVASHGHWTHLSRILGVS